MRVTKLKWSYGATKNKNFQSVSANEGFEIEIDENDVDVAKSFKIMKEATIETVENFLKEELAKIPEKESILNKYVDKDNTIKTATTPFKPTAIIPNINDVKPLPQKKYQGLAEPKAEEDSLDDLY